MLLQAWQASHSYWYIYILFIFILSATSDPNILEPCIQNFSAFLCCYGFLCHSAQVSKFFNCSPMVGWRYSATIKPKFFSYWRRKWNTISPCSFMNLFLCFFRWMDEYDFWISDFRSMWSYPLPRLEPHKMSHQIVIYVAYELLWIWFSILVNLHASIS